MPNYTYKATQDEPGQWVVKRFDGTTGADGEPAYRERLITVPVDWYEQQVIQKAIAEGSWA